MNILITAGSTRSAIDQVRCVSTIFTGRTGAQLARVAWGRGHTVTFVTSNVDRLPDLPAEAGLSERRMNTIIYQTIDDLSAIVQQQIRGKEIDVLVHTAASSDYLVSGAYSPELGTYFNARTIEWESRSKPKMVEQSADRVNSTEPELWVRLVRAPRFLDHVRDRWGYKGHIVRFTVEMTAKSDGELRGAAEFTRKQSSADLIVATTMDSVAHSAIVGPVDAKYERVSRRELPDRLMLIIEHMRRTGQGSWHDNE
jgi:phosphopantothenate---cysteine ligase (CTP)